MIDCILVIECVQHNQRCHQSDEIQATVNIMLPTEMGKLEVEQGWEGNLRFDFGFVEFQVSSRHSN